MANAAMSGQELPPYLQCVPYAREVSGIDIYGDAHTWWEQAAGRFERGATPREGAVMAFVPTGNMPLGHVAAVARVIDSRTVLLDHANWSPIDGRRGQIERNVKAVDVSPNNDWSEVRVWYHPLQALGTTAWPVHGFIYSDGTPRAQPRQQFARATPQPTRAEPSKTFLAAFASTPERSTAPQRVAPQRRATAPRIAYETARPLQPRPASDSGDREVVRRAVALYD
ncbi:CHAP domain-containing protein [Alteriqipengyuania lutimaris]|uniref:CHAP domain-containing protein n=1 Tax=Alteriqipengyuania lutimaris TaxID=1538146 RepID=A0A395LKK2_9SPHN|nr:CHAP domain-containing protein [Alteriqipengyuania lutimaris]MBB3033517.1 surface antigen [Alteriqipengyuania lutimaris]RDS77472.1 CHAP domain-containing protein [Alteriqipengyuania lutimaris]